MALEELTSFTDEELLIRCRKADATFIRQAVGEVARRHHRGLINYMRRFVGNDRAAAEDLAQDTFVRLLKHARNYKEIAKVTTWLYRIAHNLACNELRRRSYRPKVSLDKPIASEDGAALSQVVSDGTPDPSALTEKKDIQELVRRLIGELPETYRSVMVLIDVQGLTYQEAADVLEVKIGTVRSRLSRAREKFIDIIKPYLPAV